MLTVCAGAAEHELFVRLASRTSCSRTSTSRPAIMALGPFAWSQDATNLSFEDEVVRLRVRRRRPHHTSAPHGAVLEMYRVARRGIIVVESRDSVLMRAANRLGFAAEHEVAAVIDNAFLSGGLNNTEVPNYVYRWTEAEFTKTVRSFNPIGPPHFPLLLRAQPALEARPAGLGRVQPGRRPEKHRLVEEYERAKEAAGARRRRRLGASGGVVISRKGGRGRRHRPGRRRLPVGAARSSARRRSAGARGRRRRRSSRPDRSARRRRRATTRSRRSAAPPGSLRCRRNHS